MSILLIRHGETALNVARVLQPADTPLSPRGIAQADALARRLSSAGVVHVISSDLPRARLTAERIAAATGASIDSTPLLRERDFGDWRGQSYDDLPADALTMRDAPPAGESAEAFEARVARAFAHIVALRGTVGGLLAVVTHGLVVREVLGAHIALPEDAAPITHLGNTCLTEFAAEPPHRATLVNSTTHLDDATHDDARALSGG